MHTEVTPYSKLSREQVFKKFSLIWLYIFTNSPARVGFDTRSILSEVLQVSSQIFLSLGLVASPKLKKQSVLLSTHSWRENIWIHTFPKGISAM